MEKLKELLSEKDQHYQPGFPKGKDFKAWKDELYEKQCVGYTKKPFSGVKSFIDYLGIYSQKKWQLQTNGLSKLAIAMYVFLTKTTD